ncbi:MAG: hypothetical protein U0930_23460 [Pirellulales bacterium]
MLQSHNYADIQHRMTSLITTLDDACDPDFDRYDDALERELYDLRICQSRFH